jgi:DNA-damage-inducible protein J
MNGQTKMLHVRIDEALKDRAATALAAMGLSTADAIRLFFHRIVAEQAFPLELKVPNADTRAAIAEADEIVRSRRMRFTDADALVTALEDGER